MGLWVQERRPVSTQSMSPETHDPAMATPLRDPQGPVMARGDQLKRDNTLWGRCASRAYNLSKVNISHLISGQSLTCQIAGFGFSDGGGTERARVDHGSLFVTHDPSDPSYT